MPTQKSTRWFRAAMLLLLALCLATLNACSGAADEAQLRAQLAGLQQTITDKNASEMADYFSEDFVGPDGMSKQDARRMAVGLFMRYSQIGLNTGPLQVQIHDGGQTAQARFSAVVTGGSGRLLPDSGQVHQVTTEWRVEDGQWKLLAAQWSQ